LTVVIHRRELSISNDTELVTVRYLPLEMAYQLPLVIFSVPVTCRDLRGLYHIFHNVHDLDINIYEQLHRWACFDVSTKLDIGRFSVDTYEVMISGGTGGSVRGHGPPSSTTNIFNTS
jgi:hypothetical protein